MSQTSYSINMATAVAGMVADGAGAPNSIVSRVSPTDEIVFGTAVALVSGQVGQVEHIDNAGDIVEGIAVRDLTTTIDAASVENAAPADSEISVMRKGRVWVKVEEAVAVDDDVFVRHTANGGNTTLGAFRTDDDTARAIQITNARYITSTSGPGIAIVEINLP